MGWGQLVKNGARAVVGSRRCGVAVTSASVRAPILLNRKILIDNGIGTMKGAGGCGVRHMSSARYPSDDYSR